MNKERIADLMRQLIVELGEDPEREGLLDTPRRVADAWEQLLVGYSQDEGKVLQAVFEHEPGHAPEDDLVIVSNIEFYSLCEHHMLPMRGKVHVAYVPNGQIIGLSKIPRLVDLYTRRLQVQERFTTQIADALMTHLAPQGVMVVSQAIHFCVMMRGVEKELSHTTVATIRGIFRKKPYLESKVQQYLALGFTPHGL